MLLFIKVKPFENVYTFLVILSSQRFVSVGVIFLIFAIYREIFLMVVVFYFCKIYRIKGEKIVGDHRKGRPKITNKFLHFKNVFLLHFSLWSENL